MDVAHRLFFGILPSLWARVVMGGVRDAQPGIAAPVANDRLHLTAGISADHGVFPERIADEMIAIGDAACAEPFEVRLDRLAASHRSVALRPAAGNAGLQRLREQLIAPLARLGILREGWRFSPHVTLGYRDGAPFGRTVPAIGWQAREFVLIHSLVGATRHVVLRRWPLLTHQGELFA